MTDRKYLAFGILAIAVIGIILICGCTGQPGATGQTTPTPAGASPSPAPSQSNQPTATPTPSQLKIVVKDYGLPEVKYLQPTITEIQLQNQSKGWVTIWSSPEGKTVKLTSDGAEIVLDSVSLEAGTYIGAKLKVTTVDVEVDINRDGDTIDKNVEVIMTKAEFDLLPPGERPSGSQQPPSSPSPPPQPPSPSPPEGPPPELQAPPASQGTLYLKEPPSGQEPPSGPQQPPAPSQPPGPSKPSKPEWSPGVTFDGTYVHMGVFLDEVHTATFNDFFVPLWGKDFVYGGSGGTIVFDFTLHPCLPKHEQVSVEVSTET